ncbi:MAG: NIPSNAP family protein [Phaeodactylibacter sp.]|nr:NIPSNAP family protein [Phaeodactylibacter sp.]MCB9299702.1 NIPSNAP family protein [Lewinellaceae bacterium]
MNPTKFLLLITGIFTLASCKTMDTNHSTPLAQSREYYQLKIYTFDTDEQVQTTDNYLKEAYLPGLKRLGIQNIGVFKPSPDGTDSVKKILILVPFSSLAQFLTLEEELGKDQTYLSAGQDYIGVSHQHPPYSRFESILLKAFEDMPAMQASKLDGPRANRIYELRSYESPTEAYFKNKVDMFNAGGEIKLFERLGFNAVFYAEVISGPKMPNLMYMTTFSGLSSREEHWKEFGEAPEWEKLKAMPKYMNNVSHIDISYLYPTEYSDY